MEQNRRARFSLGTSMPAWLPTALHMPVRLALGLFVGAIVAIYAVGLALAANRVLDALAGVGDPAYEMARLLALLMGAVLLRHAAVRAVDGRAHDL